MIYLSLFLQFFKTGLLAVGGGMATLPFLYEISEKYGWYTKNQLSDMIAISEATPGPIGINMATYAGQLTADFLGGIIAVLGLVLPSFIIVLLVVKMTDKYKENKYIKSIFDVLRPAAVALIASAGIKVAETVLLSSEINFFDNIKVSVNFKALILFAVLFVATKIFKKLHPFLILIGGVAGYLFFV